MNQTKLLLIGIMGIGVLILCVGLYIAFKPNEVPVVQTSPVNSVPTPINSTIAPAKTPQSTPIKITRDLTVPSGVMWYDTGIDVPSDSTLKINYKGGQWTNVVGSNFVDGQGKGGYAQRNLLIVPSSQLSALVAKVGEYKFHVGNSYSGKPGSGRLYLSLNDIPKTYNDNDGELDVSVEVK
jgi:hypothetical protein